MVALRKVFVHYIIKSFCDICGQSFRERGVKVIDFPGSFIFSRFRLLKLEVCVYISSLMKGIVVYVGFLFELIGVYKYVPMGVI